ncbi:MAG: hypothetical protein IJ646_11725 [Clostridia bacterium]|nr:hypothetical protein [Clostridia bacterium]
MKKRHKLMTTIGVAACAAVACAAIGFAGTQLSRTAPDKVAAARVEVVATTMSAPTPAPEGELVYYATVNGNYYHTDPVCSGMVDVLPMTADAALALGKQACPVCCGSTLTLCWATDEGQYYHRDRECSGMWGAKYCTVTQARARGQWPCPVCWIAD